MEQKIKFYVKLQDNLTSLYRFKGIKFCGRVLRDDKESLNGQETVEDEPRSGLPITSPT